MNYMIYMIAVSYISGQQKEDVTTTFLDQINM